MGKRNLHMIEELLERYFEGETSAAEEKQIRASWRTGFGTRIGIRSVPLCEPEACSPLPLFRRGCLRAGSVESYPPAVSR